ncbi:glutathione hydrolase 1 proenzyme isoform X2 [Pectinophora gossypiella]|uniref:glutathione hydrolase 1 proenzyme isoform X2 n=1 Tax=Pectinophora gossypiella TaxID=13191 RepID=UPI00214F11CB|nr:glutathione hydrolase 1 proenzyme isoform X2 [Pectinophora gossypiella]XP_049873162.1 glutathione hydrolase 1 proenzyme isoform X2 [Pectinophora gossypiella]
MCDREQKELLRKSSLKNDGEARRKNLHVLIKVPDSHRQRPYKFRTKLLITGTVILVFVAALAGYLIGSSERSKRMIEPPDPLVPPGPSYSVLRRFKKAAVCTDSPLCSGVGKAILLKKGTAVDATIAAMFCNGLLNHQSMGVGGGFYMTVYIKDEGKAYVVNARESAPGQASADMFKGNSDKATKGPLAVAVPAETRGLWAAYQQWGKLPWATLLAPTIKICEDGYNISKALYDGLEAAAWIKNDPHLRKQYYDSSKGKFYKVGTVVKPSTELCNSLKRIAENGGDELYTGALSKDFIEDLADVKSIITEEDLRNYKAKIEEPIKVTMSNGDTLYTPAPPSSGIVLAHILNILQGYNFTSDDIKTNDDKIRTYHRITEAFKFAFGARTKLGDRAFLNITDLLDQLASPDYGEQIRQQINESTTSNDTAVYGAEEYTGQDSGTAHISIVAENGDAVSVTSSLNFYFGAGFSTKRTGIVLNNVMDDFSSPGFKNYFGLSPSPANFIKPGKRPLSSMVPSIIVDDMGNAKFVVGGSGGTKIITAVALATMRKMWFNQSIKEAIDEPRFHQQLFPMYIDYEYGIPQDIVTGLRAKGHGMKRYRGRGSIVCALYRNSSGIYANSDYRKGGDVYGTD